MGDFKMKKDFLTRNLLYKVLIFIATVAVIVYFMPRDGKCLTSASRGSTGS